MQNPENDDAVVRHLINDQIVLKAARFAETKLGVWECQQAKSCAAARIGFDVRDGRARRFLKRGSNLGLVCGQINAMSKEVQLGSWSHDELTLHAERLRSISAL